MTATLTAQEAVSLAMGELDALRRRHHAICAAESCPECSAPKGRRCTSPSGRELHRPHKPRRDAYDAAIAGDSWEVLQEALEKLHLLAEGLADWSVYYELGDLPAAPGHQEAAIELATREAAEAHQALLRGGRI